MGYLGRRIGLSQDKGDNSWTDTFEDRKVYSNKSDADSDTSITVTRNGVTYTPRHFDSCVVVSE